MSTTVPPPQKIYKWRRTPSQTVNETLDYPASVNLTEDSFFKDYDSPRCCLIFFGIREGICYMLIGIALTCFMQILVKIILDNHFAKPIEIAYFRFIGLLIGNIIYAIIISEPIFYIRRTTCKKLLLRSFSGSLAVICFGLSLSQLDYLQAVILSFLSKSLSSLYQYFSNYVCSFLGILTHIGICGYMIWLIISLHEEYYYGVYASILGSIFAAISFLIGKDMNYEIHYAISHIYLGIVGIFISSLGIFILHYTGFSPIHLSFKNMLYCLLISFIGWLGQFFQSLGMQKESSLKIAMTMFFMIFYAVIFELYWEESEIAKQDWGGVVILIVSDILSWCGFI